MVAGVEVEKVVAEAVAAMVEVAKVAEGPVEVTAEANT